MSLSPTSPERFHGFLATLAASSLYEINGFCVVDTSTSQRNPLSKNEWKQLILRARSSRLGLAVVYDGPLRPIRSILETHNLLRGDASLPIVLLPLRQQELKTRRALPHAVAIELASIGTQASERMKAAVPRWLATDAELASSEAATPFLRPMLAPNLATRVHEWLQRGDELNGQPSARPQQLIEWLRIKGQQTLALSSATSLVFPPSSPPPISPEAQSSLEDVKVFLRAFVQGQAFQQEALVILISGPMPRKQRLLASALLDAHNLPLYRVEVAQLISKWVGETEKRVEEVFSLSRQLGLPLLFEGAELLFGRRTETSQSAEKYGNMAVNYLLQTLDHHQGVVFVSSPSLDIIDPAFRRRFQCHLELELPTAQIRRTMWQDALESSSLQRLSRAQIDSLATVHGLTEAQIFFCVDLIAALSKAPSTRQALKTGEARFERLHKVAVRSSRID